MKTVYLIPLVALFMIACSKKPHFCTQEYPVEQIILTPVDPGWGGDTIAIKNDTLIKFIADQICRINEKETFFSTGKQGLRFNIEIRFLPNQLPEDKKLFVAYNEIGDKTYVIREGEHRYFKNDTLCKLVAKLTNTYVEPK